MQRLFNIIQTKNGLVNSCFEKLCLKIKCLLVEIIYRMKYPKYILKYNIII